MPSYRLNRSVASACIAAAAAFAAVGGTGYAVYGALTSPDSPETAEQRRQSYLLRDEIITYLPLAREMIVAAPPYEYPESAQGSLNRTLGLGDEIIGNKGKIGDIEARCDVVTYLRAIHRRAAENYLASNPALPLPNMQTHIDAINRPAPVVPLCQKQ